MRPLRSLLPRDELLPLVPVALAALVLFVRLGAYGFWEPHEIQIADRARAALAHTAATAAEVDDEPAAAPAAPQAGAAREPGMAEPDKPDRKVKKPATATAEGPRLTADLVERGIEVFGQSELGARFFLALAGLVAVLAVSLLGARLGGGRAGMLAGLVFLSFPLVVLESRHLTSDVGALAGAGLLGLGLVGLVRPSKLGWLAPPWTYALDALLVVAGGLLAVRGAAPWNGLVPPLAGVGLGALVVALGREPDADPADADPDLAADRRARLRGLIAGGVLVATAVLVLAVILHQVFDLIDVPEGERGLFGKTLQPTGDHASGLGGTWRREGDPAATTTTLFEQIAFGAFPWVAVAPLAIAGLGLGAGGARRFPAAVLAGWTLVAWATATLFEHKVGATTYPAFAAIAIAIGLWLDALWARRARPDAPGAADLLPIAAVFVLAAAVVIGRDLYNFPDRLTSLNLDGATVKWPEGSKLHLAMPVLGVLFGAAMLLALVPVGRLVRFARHGVTAAVVLGVVGAIFFSQVFSPRLGERLSSKGVFATFEDLRQDGDVLGIVGNPGPGPKFYAGKDYVELRGRTELIDFLRRPERVFALVRAGELCPLHKAAGAVGQPYVVVDDSNDQFLLLSNQLRAGERDHNPLATAIVRTRPADLGRPLDYELEGQIRLIGVRMPATVERGETFDVTLIFEVLKPITRNWKVFVHFDAASSRFQGDHDPIRGRCGTSYLQAGDVVLDTFSVKAGSMVDGTPRTTFTVFAGFFVGTAPNYTNMKVTKGKADDNNRVQLGTIRVQ